MGCKRSRVGNSGFQLNVFKIPQIINYHRVMSFTQKRLDWFKTRSHCKITKEFIMPECYLVLQRTTDISTKAFGRFHFQSAHAQKRITLLILLSFSGECIHQINNLHYKGIGRQMHKSHQRQCFNTVFPFRKWRQ